MILANYEPAPALVYQHPGADSYKGSFATAVELLARATGVSAEVLYNISSYGRCRIRSWRQGEVADAMVYGKDRVVRGVYLDINSWPPLASRLITECSDGLGNSLILPEVCSNWTYERTELSYGGEGGWQSAGEAGEVGSSSELGEAAGISSGEDTSEEANEFSPAFGFLPNGFLGSGLNNNSSSSNPSSSNANSANNNSNNSSSSSGALPPTYISTPPNLMPPELIPSLPSSPSSPANEPSSVLGLILALSLTWLIKRGIPA